MKKKVGCCPVDYIYLLLQHPMTVVGIVYFASFSIISLDRVTNLLMRSGDRLPWESRARS